MHACQLNGGQQLVQLTTKFTALCFLGTFTFTLAETSILSVSAGRGRFWLIRGGRRRRQTCHCFFFQCNSNWRSTSNGTSNISALFGHMTSICNTS
jgi:hypothetical protein